MFESVQKGPPDPVYLLKQRADGDKTSTKVDLGVGIYRSETGLYHCHESVSKVSVHHMKDFLQSINTRRQAKLKLLNDNPGHNVGETSDRSRCSLG